MDSIIVDIDGTLADTRHRLHYLARTPKDWDGFYSEMDKDPPHQNTIDVVRALGNVYGIILVTARPQRYGDVTRDWLGWHNIAYSSLWMRKDSDYRPGAEVKRDILEVLQRDHNIVMAIEDQPDVVKMWRDNGVPCMQVDHHSWYAPINEDDDHIEWLEWMYKQHYELRFQKVADELKRLYQIEDDVWSNSMERNLLT